MLFYLSFKADFLEIITKPIFQNPSFIGKKRILQISKFPFSCGKPDLIVLSLKLYHYQESYMIYSNWQPAGMALLFPTKQRKIRTGGREGVEESATRSKFEHSDLLFGIKIFKG